MKAMVLFSGGKDSFYALAKALETHSVAYVVSIMSQSGDTQLHAGPEANEAVRKAQLNLLELPYEQIAVGSGKDYMHELFIGLHHLVQRDGITHLFTGDLWHPYTSGIGDMLAGALGVTLVRPAREACLVKACGAEYLEKIISTGIESVVVSVRHGDLSEHVVGRKIDEALVKEFVSMNVDVTGEGGEYQSLVLAAAQMKGRIVIDDFSVALVDGKNGKEKFHRMFVDAFHIEK